LKGAVGNPIELFLISLSVVALFDLPLSAVFCAANVGTAISSFAHANVRSDPPRWYAFFFTTIRHHSLHHSVPYEDTRCNYANSLILIDRIFGTFREGEADVVGQDQRKRLSIREQFAFPFVPLIAMIKAKPGRSAPV
jgi:sterol desaturase/sphingolipid hydroxylase (fatty acid hydroxylase superfamily)